jgi:hypothetical protein
MPGFGSRVCGDRMMLQLFFNCSNLCRRIHGSMINLNLPQAYDWGYTCHRIRGFEKMF